MASIAQLRRTRAAARRPGRRQRGGAAAAGLGRCARAAGRDAPFGALRAVDDVSLTVAAGERRAILGANGAGKTTLFNAVTGDFPPTAGRDRFFGEDITDAAAPRAHPAGPAPHLPVLAAVPRPHACATTCSSPCAASPRPLQLLPAAARGHASQRGDRGSARAHPPRHVADDPVADAVARPAAPARDRHGAGRRAAPDPVRRAGRRACRRPSGASWSRCCGRCRAHMGFVLIEHDLDIALRVVERVTVMHNGRVLKHGTPAEIENDAEVQAIYMGRQALMAAFRAARRPAPRGPMLAIEDLDVYYGRAHALQGVSLHARRAACSRVVGRNGMGKTTLCNAITGSGARARQHPPARRGDPRPAAAPDHRPRHRLRAAGPSRLALAERSTSTCAWWRGRSGAWTSSASTRPFRGWPSARANGGAQLSGGEQQMLAIAARCCSIRACSSWTSRPKGWRR